MNTNVASKLWAGAALGGRKREVRCGTKSPRGRQREVRCGTKSPRGRQHEVRCGSKSPRGRQREIRCDSKRSGLGVRNMLGVRSSSRRAIGVESTFVDVST